MSASNPLHAMALIRLRVELFGAAQMLKGGDLEDLRTLVADVALILDVGKPTATSSPTTSPSGDGAASACGVCSDGNAPCPIIDPPHQTQWTCLACGRFVGEALRSSSDVADSSTSNEAAKSATPDTGTLAHLVSPRGDGVAIDLDHPRGPLTWELPRPRAIELVAAIGRTLDGIAALPDAALLSAAVAAHLGEPTMDVLRDLLVELGRQSLSPDRQRALAAARELVGMDDPQWPEWEDRIFAPGQLVRVAADQVGVHAGEVGRVAVRPRIAGVLVVVEFPDDMWEAFEPHQLRRVDRAVTPSIQPAARMAPEQREDLAGTAPTYCRTCAVIPCACVLSPAASDRSTHDGEGG